MTYVLFLFNTNLIKFEYICSNLTYKAMINPVYSAADDRYSNGMKYRRCGRSVDKWREMGASPREVVLMEFLRNFLE